MPLRQGDTSLDDVPSGDVTQESGFDSAIEPTIDQYRSVSLRAVFGLVAGVVSAAALLAIELLIVPMFAVAANIWALRRIAYYAPSLGGRWLAQLGLGLSLAFAVAAVANWATFREGIRIQGRQVAQAWFGYLLAGQPHKAHQLTLVPSERQPLDENLWDVYRRFPERRTALQAFLDDPLIATLIALGPDATVRYYGTEKLRSQTGQHLLNDIYAVTYEDEGRQRTFFVAMTLLRAETPDTGEVQWRVLLANGGIRPKQWRHDADQEPAGQARGATQSPSLPAAGRF